MGNVKIFSSQTREMLALEKVIIEKLDLIQVQVNNINSMTLRATILSNHG